MLLLSLLVVSILQGGGSSHCKTDFILKVETDRASYGINDEMTVTFYTLNDSGGPLYLYPPPSIWDRSYIHPSGSDLRFWKPGAATEVTIVKMLRHGGGFGHLGEGSAKEIVEQHYHILRPQQLIGATTTIDLSQLGIKKGEYEINVTVFNDEPSQWRSDELESLRYPIFCGEKESDRIRIVIE